MPIVFACPSSAKADVNELEYCSAIRQTNPFNLRQNGSLTTTDIALHILSRHGVRASEAAVEHYIMVGLAGCLQYNVRLDCDFNEVRLSGRSVSSLPEQNDSSVPQSQAPAGYVRKCTPLDVVQQTSLLLIPELLKLAKGSGEASTSASGPAQEGSTGSNGDSDADQLFHAILLVILEEAGLEYGVELTEDVIRRLLGAFGEHHWPDDVVSRMLALASENERGEPVSEVPVLDEATFIRALTRDVALYNINWEEQATTHFEDVNSDELALRVARRRASALDKFDYDPPSPVPRSYTAAEIDSAADGYASFWWTAWLWYTFFALFVGYMFLSLQDNLQGVSCSELSEFGCSVANAIVFWLEVFVSLALIGFAFIYLGSLGNSIYLLNTSKRWWAVGSTLIAIAAVAVAGILGFLYEISTLFFDTTKNNDFFIPVYYTSIVTGIIVIYHQAMQLLRVLLPRRDWQGCLGVFLRSSLRFERQTKQAASFKVKRMLDRALACHRIEEDDTGVASQSQSSYSINRQRLGVHGRVSEALHRFQIKEGETESVGGVWWTIRSILCNSSLASTEGVWLHPRLFFCNLVQFTVLVALSWIWGIADILIREIGDPVVPGLSVAGAQTSLAIGGAVALVACAFTVAIFIPSTVSTVLQFRSGFIGSLRDCADSLGFRPLRVRQDTITLLFGAFFFGSVFSAVLLWSVIALIALSFFYEYTRPYFIFVVSQLIGIVTTILLKVLILFLLQYVFIASYYRKRPLGSNVISVVLECWNLGLSTGYTLARSAKLFLIALFYIGRVDVPFLARGVGQVFAANLDNYSQSFRKDLLIHEAHRHPYMERWATLYLLKLRHGTDFGSRAGAAWRILFTLALMPWMRKYRVHPAVKLHSKASSALVNDNIDQFESGHLTDALVLLEKEQSLRKEMEAELERYRRAYGQLPVDATKGDGLAISAPTSIFNENVLKEREAATIRDNDAVEQPVERDSSTQVQDPSPPTPPTLRGVHRSTSSGAPVCAVCYRKFDSVEKLRRHEATSKLHAENLARWNEQHGQQQVDL